MKKNDKTLVLMFILFASIVFEVSGGLSLDSIISTLVIEVILSIPMIKVVMKPAADVFDPDKSKHLFIILLVIRAIIILIYALFFNFSLFIFYIDFFVIFIGATFIESVKRGIINIGVINNTGAMLNVNDEHKVTDVLKCTKCGKALNAKDIFCPSCGTLVEGKDAQDTCVAVPTNPSYLVNEKIILEKILIEEIKTQGENNIAFTTTSLKKKKNLLLIVFGIATFIITVMYYLNYSLLLCGFIELIVLLVYYSISKKFNVIEVLKRQAIKNPDEEITKLVKDIIIQKDISALNIRLKFLMVLLIVIALPTIFFFNPRIIYTSFEDGYSIIKYTRGIVDNEKNVVIPKSYKGKKVLAIGESAFENTNIKSINLPIGLEAIKTMAFRNCRRLVSIDIPSTVQEIRGSAFENDTQLKNVVLHEGLKEIRGGAFKNNISLSEIDLPDSLEYLGGSVFSNCRSLVTITIPRKVTEINGQTFEYCTSLRQINLHDDIISIHGETFVGDISLNNVILPSKITEVKGNTFDGCTSLTSIIIPEGVTRIGGHAFYGCSNLNYVSIPSTIIEIGSSAFRQCYSLQNIRVPYSTEINERAFKESPTYVERY